MTDLISRADAIAFINSGISLDTDADREYATEMLKNIPSAEAVKVAYICDGRKCDSDCSDCFRTLDIEHARDFKLMGDTYFQQEAEAGADRHRGPADGRGTGAPGRQHEGDAERGVRIGGER